MSCYISSKENRFYVSGENSLGVAAVPTAEGRITAVKLEAREETSTAERRDKTGSRTYVGVPNTVKKDVEFELETYLTSWSGSGAPAVGTLWESALGGAARSQAAQGVSGVSGTTVTFAGGHSRQPGDAVVIGDELRFVNAVPDTGSVVVNAPFAGEVIGAQAAGSVSYGPATKLKSFTLWDYWTPESAVQRGLAGSVVDEAEVLVNGDWHEFLFRGPAARLVDSASFEAGEAGLSSYPDEPDSTGFNYAIVPGHLGQFWAGLGSQKMQTLAEAKVTLKNHAELGKNYFGSGEPRCVAADTREVLVEFTIFATDEADALALYQAARAKTPVPIAIQLGSQAGQLFGVYMPSVVLETPAFDDSEVRLQWTFRGRAQGTNNDEIYVAFG